MKFENIKAGDTVYLQVKVGLAWGETNWFWVPKKVSSITPKRFKVDVDTYKKNDGCILGKYFEYARKLGEAVELGKTVTDQTKQMEAFSLSIKLNDEISDILERITLGRKHNHTHKNLNKIHKKLKEVEALIADDHSLI